MATDICKKLFFGGKIKFENVCGLEKKHEFEKRFTPSGHVHEFEKKFTNSKKYNHKLKK